MPSRTYLYQSADGDVYRNLAIEEHLLETIPEGDACFLTYVNSGSVVIGKHQNPWREVRLDALRSGGLALARRISGGGAVYHDEGNLNFAFIAPKARFDRLTNLRAVAGALAALGADCEINERYDLTVGGRKISGSAFCFRRERVLHHGTLLVSARLDRLSGVLGGTLGAISTPAIASRPSPVANLSSLYPGLTVETVRAGLVASLGATWTPLPESAIEGVSELLRRNARDEWLYDATPRFTIAFPVGSPAGGRTVDLSVEHGKIVSAGEPGLDRLVGSRFSSAEMERRLEEGAPPEGSAAALLLRALRSLDF